jgi:hypothetical protein
LRFYGNYCKTSKGRAEAEVQQPQAQSMPALRAAAGFPAQVRRLPFVFPGARAEGRDTWSQQVELVKRQLSVIGNQLFAVELAADANLNNFI